MTYFYGLNGAGDTNTGYPGCAPSGAGAMQGNPNPPGDVPDYVPAQQCGAAQTVNTPSTPAQIAQGNVTHNAQPTNVNVAAGGVSLMALISSGQVSLNQSNYGQGSLAPLAGGQPVIPAPAVQPIAAGIASVPTFASPCNQTGD